MYSVSRLGRIVTNLFSKVYGHLQPTKRTPRHVRGGVCDQLYEPGQACDSHAKECCQLRPKEDIGGGAPGGRCRVKELLIFLINPFLPKKKPKTDRIF